MGPNKKRKNSNTNQELSARKKARKSSSDTDTSSNSSNKKQNESRNRKKLQQTHQHEISSDNMTDTSRSRNKVVSRKSRVKNAKKNSFPVVVSSPVKTKAKESVKHIEKVTATSSSGTENGQTQSQRYSCWLMKSEPETRMENGVDVKFGFEDLKACPNKTSYWDGVRNYQARNFMRDQMKIGDRVFFYHSNTKIPGIVGVCSIVKEAYPDHTQFDKKSPYYDPKSEETNPRWLMVDVKYEYDLKRYIPLPELKKFYQEHKASGGALRNIALFTKARLSVQPVSEEEWDFIVKLSEK